MIVIKFVWLIDTIICRIVAAKKLLLAGSIFASSLSLSFTSVHFLSVTVLTINVRMQPFLFTFRCAFVRCVTLNRQNNRICTPILFVRCIVCISFTRVFVCAPLAAQLNANANRSESALHRNTIAIILRLLEFNRHAERLSRSSVAACVHCILY